MPVFPLCGTMEPWNWTRQLRFSSDRREAWKGSVWGSSWINFATVIIISCIIIFASLYKVLPRFFTCTMSCNHSDSPMRLVFPWTSSRRSKTKCCFPGNHWSVCAVSLLLVAYSFANLLLINFSFLSKFRFTDLLQRWQQSFPIVFTQLPPFLP